jgi:hypothetical protein
MTTDPPSPSPKNPGRPTRDTRVEIRVSTREYDALYERARRDRLTLSEYIRRAIRDEGS